MIGPQCFNYSRIMSYISNAIGSYESDILAFDFDDAHKSTANRLEFPKREKERERREFHYFHLISVVLACL